MPLQQIEVWLALDVDDICKHAYAIPGKTRRTYLEQTLTLLENNNRTPLEEIKLLALTQAILATLPKQSLPRSVAKRYLETVQHRLAQAKESALERPLLQVMALLAFTSRPLTEPDRASLVGAFEHCATHALSPNTREYASALLTRGMLAGDLSRRAG